MTPEIQLSHWLAALPHGSYVGIDEGGLCLRAVRNGSVTVDYFEVGGIPEEIEERWKARGGSDYWCDRPGHPVEDWQYEVQNGTTRQSYQDWCNDREEIAAIEGQVLCLVCGAQIDTQGQCDSDHCQALPESEVCVTCSRPYAPFGDGWDGECPHCADKTANETTEKG